MLTFREVSEKIAHLEAYLNVAKRIEAGSDTSSLHAALFQFFSQSGCVCLPLLKEYVKKVGVDFTAAVSLSSRQVLVDAITATKVDNRVNFYTAYESDRLATDEVEDAQRCVFLDVLTLVFNVKPENFVSLFGFVASVPHDAVLRGVAEVDSRPWARILGKLHPS